MDIKNKTRNVQNKAALNAGFRLLSLLSIFLILQGCFNKHRISGGGASDSGSSSASFDGCLSTSSVNTSRIDVSYEWPNGASAVSVLRNGITVFSSVDGTAGTFQDTGLQEGSTYTYTCSASFSSSSGAFTVKNGRNVLNETTQTIASPTFYGLSNVTQTSSSNARVTWPAASRVPAAQYIVVAKLGAPPSSQDFDATNSSTQSLITQKKIIRSVIINPASTQATLSELGDGLEYYFAVQACFESDVCSMGDGSNDYMDLSISDNGAPQSTGVTFAQIQSSQVVLTAPWNASNGQVSVRRVYQNTTGGTDINKYTNVQNFTVSDPNSVPTSLALSASLGEAMTYYFIVRDEDSLGQVSQNTQVRSVRTGGFAAPVGFLGIRPSHELESNAQGQILVKWAWNTAALDFDLSAYKGFLIYSVNPQNSSLTEIANCACSSGDCKARPLTQCLVSDLDPYRTYRLHVRAYGPSGRVTTNLDPSLNYSDKRVLDTTAPVFVSRLRSEFSNGVNLSWATASDNQFASEPGSIISYQVWRKTASTFASSTDPNTDGTLVSTLSTNTYLDKSVAEGSAYYYTICALDASINRTCDGVVEEFLMPDTSSPTLLISDDKTSTSKDWNLALTISDNTTPSSSLAVTIRRKVSPSNSDFPTSSDPVLISGYGLNTLRNEGNPAIPGTAGLNRYINYLVRVSDQAGNTTSQIHSVHLDNTPPSSTPKLLRFSPLPTLGSRNPSVRGVLSANSALVSLYLTSDCSGAPAVSGAKSVFEETGFVISVPSSNTNSIYAQAITSAATRGACELLGYYDNVAPSLASIRVNGPSNRGNSDLNWNLSYGAYSNDMTAYCLLLNSTNAADCESVSPTSSGWVKAATLPTKYTSATRSDGSYQVSAYIRDASLNMSPVAVSNTISIDASRPVWNSLVLAQDWTTSSVSTPSVRVGALDATDASGIKGYEWAIGTSASNNLGDCSETCSNMKPWTPLTTPSFTPSGIAPMSHNTTYYVNVKVSDNAGNDTIRSDSFLTDFLDPVAPEFTTPSANEVEVDVRASGKFTYQGRCEVGAFLHVRSGPGVTITRSPVCMPTGVFTIDTLIGALTQSGRMARELTIYSEKPSGLRSPSITRVINARGACPPSYLGVAGNPAYGTSDFCVAKFEMKAVTSNPTLGKASLANVNGNVWPTPGWFPDSRPDGTPFVNIDPRASVVICDKLNPASDGTGPYQLISNAQWQSMATEIERVAANWSGSNPEAGIGQLARGHTDNVVSDANSNDSLRGLSFSAHKALAAGSSDSTTVPWNFVSNVEEFNAGYRGTGQTASQAAGSGWEQRRTHFLSNGDVVWDTAGNVAEWVRFTDPASNLDTGIKGNSASHYNSRLLPKQPGKEGSFELDDSSVFFDLGGDGSLLSHWFSPSLSYSPNPSAAGLGRIRLSSQANWHSIMRGGAWSLKEYAGVYATDLTFRQINAQAFSIGFRCAYNPHLSQNSH